MALTKITQNDIDTNNVKSADDTITGEPEQVKNVFDKLPEVIASKFNTLIDNLMSILDGSSGADNVGIGTDTGLVGATVKAQIKELQDNKVGISTPITPGIKCKITYGSNGLVTSGADLSKADLPPEAFLTDNIISAITPSSRTNVVPNEKAINDVMKAIGAGDMTKSVYDTNGKNSDAFNSANHVFSGAGITATNTQGAINEVNKLLSWISELEPKTTVFNLDGSITETFASGKTIVTVFNADGSITETFTSNGTAVIKTTIFNADGSISEVIS